jgi:hypothetical protein
VKSPSCEADLSPTTIPVWLAVLMGALAGGMGWGIRGQYGHETGAMIAGVLVGSVVIFCFSPRQSSLAAMRAAAMFAVGIGIGGSMTYGQTIGLTQDKVLIGNGSALVWGMTGLAIKGGIWIGLAGLLLGAGLGGIRYRWYEWLAVAFGALLVARLGIWLLNEPYEPSAQRLPYIYFSESWRWKPDSVVKPRREVWGGLLMVFLAVATFTRLRGDRLGWRLGGWGFLGGALGFPAGQCLQAYHAWNAEWFQSLAWDRHINWWNMMEITFGAIMGATLCLGVGIHRRAIALAKQPKAPCPAWLEWLLAMIHVGLLIGAEFTTDLPWISRLYDDGIPLVVLPLVCLAVGRFWPFLQLLPITMIPILGKTIRRMVYQEAHAAEWIGWTVYGVLPLAVAMAVALLNVWRSDRESAWAPAMRTLLVAVWVYLALNFAFFDFPFPWQAWTARTPSNLIFVGCTVGLSLAAFRRRRRSRIAGC